MRYKSKTLLLFFAITLSACKPELTITQPPSNTPSLPSYKPFEIQLNTNYKLHPIRPIAIIPIITQYDLAPMTISVTSSLPCGSATNLTDLQNQITVDVRQRSKAVLITQKLNRPLICKPYLLDVTFSDGTTSLTKQLGIEHSTLDVTAKVSPQWPFEQLIVNAYAGTNFIFEDIGFTDADGLQNGSSYILDGALDLTIEKLDATAKQVGLSLAATAQQIGQQKNYTLRLADGSDQSLPLFLTVNILPHPNHIVASNGGNPIDAGEPVNVDSGKQAWMDNLPNGDALIFFSSGVIQRSDASKLGLPPLQGVARYRNTLKSWDVLTQNGWGQNQNLRSLLRTNWMISRGGGVFHPNGHYYAFWSTTPHFNGVFDDDHGLFRLLKVSNLMTASSDTQGFASYYSFSSGFQDESSNSSFSSWNANLTANDRNPVTLNRSGSEMLSLLQRLDIQTGTGNPLPTQYSLVAQRINTSTTPETVQFWNHALQQWTTSSPSVLDSKLVADSSTEFNEMPEVLNGASNDFYIPFVQCTKACADGSATRKLSLIRYLSTQQRFERLTDSGWAVNGSFRALNSRGMEFYSNDSYAITTSTGELHLFYISKDLLPALNNKIQHITVSANGNSISEETLPVDATYPLSMSDFRVALFPDTQRPFILWKSQNSRRYLAGLKLTLSGWQPLKGSSIDFHYFSSNTIELVGINGYDNDELLLVIALDNRLYALSSPNRIVGESAYQPSSPRNQQAILPAPSNTWSFSGEEYDYYQLPGNFSVGNGGALALATAGWQRFTFLPNGLSSIGRIDFLSWDVFAHGKSVEMTSNETTAFTLNVTQIGTLKTMVRRIDLTGSNPQSDPLNGTVNLTSAFGLTFDGVQNLRLDETTNLLWISDSFNNRIVNASVSTNSLTQNLAFGSAGSGQTQIKRPRGLCVTSTAVYVADSHNHRIQKFSHAGVWQRSFGAYGSGSGQLMYPHEIYCTSNTLVVHDVYNSRLSVFSIQNGTEGNFLYHFHSSGNNNALTSFSMSPSGDLYLVGFKPAQIGTFIQKLNLIGVL